MNTIPATAIFFVGFSLCSLFLSLDFLPADAAFLSLRFVPDGFFALFFATDVLLSPNEMHLQSIGLGIITPSVAVTPWKSLRPFLPLFCL
jgi:hypothetical protein